MPTQSDPAARRLPKQARSASTVDRIQRTTLRLLRDHGAPGFNTNRVAEEAGVSISSLYRFFPNKEAIVRSVFERWLTEVLERVDAVAKAQRDTAGTEDFFSAIVGALRVPFADDASAQALWDVVGVYPELRDLQERHDRAMAQRIAGYLEDLGSPLDKSERMAAAYTLVDSFTAGMERSWRLRGKQAIAARNFTAAMQIHLLRKCGVLE